jgi:hypothetical protein
VVNWLAAKGLAAKNSDIMIAKFYLSRYSLAVE